MRSSTIREPRAIQAQIIDQVRRSSRVLSGRLNASIQEILKQLHGYGVVRWQKAPSIPGVTRSIVLVVAAVLGVSTVAGNREVRVVVGPSRIATARLHMFYVPVPVFDLQFAIAAEPFLLFSQVWCGSPWDGVAMNVRQSWPWGCPARQAGSAERVIVFISYPAPQSAELADRRDVGRGRSSRARPPILFAKRSLVAILFALLDHPDSGAISLWFRPSEGGREFRILQRRRASFRHRMCRHRRAGLRTDARR